MKLWRLSIDIHARVFNGGYGILNEGRWNSQGTAVTYTSTHPSLSLLEKLVHVQDKMNFPDNLKFVEYNIPDNLDVLTVEVDGLPENWENNEAKTRQMGDGWLNAEDYAVIFVPSAIVCLENANDRNALINHRHPQINEIKITAITDFEFDPRLG